jgi:hypothetical protein
VFCRYLFFGAIPDAGGGDSLMKKVLAIVLSLMLLVVFAVGCKKADTPAKAPEKKAEPVKAPEPPKAPATAPAPEKAPEKAPAPAPAPAKK